MTLPGVGAVRQAVGQVGRWLPHTPGKYQTVLSMGSRWLKVLHTSGRGASRKIDLRTAHPILGLSDEEILRWLQSFCAEKGLEPGEILVANPSALTTVRIFTLPSTNPKEIRNIVDLQAEKHTPYAKEEILTDSVVVESDRSGYSRVLVAISHQDVVHRALKLVEGMGWTLDRVGFETEGLGHWFQRAAKAESAAGETLVAELDSDATGVVIFQRGKPFYHRSLAFGGDLLRQNSEEGLRRLISEFQRTLETFEAEGLNLKVSRILLTGCAEQFAALAETVQQALSIPTQVVPGMKGFPVAEQALTDGGSVAEVSFSSLVGLALGGGAVDLTPKTVKLHRTFEVRSKVLIQLGCQLIAGLLLLSCWVIGRAYENQKRLSLLSEEHQRLAREAGVITTFMDQMKVVRLWIGSSGELLEAVEDLQRRTPSSIRWNSFTYLRGERISLKGTSPEIPRVYDFVAELKKSPRFSNVEARRTSMSKVKDREVTEFEIVCTLTPPEGQEKEPAG